MFKFFVTLCLVFISFAAQAEKTYVRGHILSFLQDPKHSLSDENYEYFSDGLLVVEDGKVAQVGEWAGLGSTVPSSAEVVHYPNGLIMPGFIDTHIHYPQLDMIAASSSGDLLKWLNTHTFPFEQRLSDDAYSKDVANFFLDQLLTNGVTTANIFGTHYTRPIEILRKAANDRHMRIITGLILADRNLPPYLMGNINMMTQRAEQLIKKLHNQPDSRFIYALQLRFAPTTSPELFEAVESLKKQYPDVRLHTHVSENKNELSWVKELYPEDDYFGVYEKYGFIGPNALLAHGVWLTDDEWKRIAATETSIAFCPTSNLFLGSGLFDLAKATKYGITVGMGTDVGAGTSFSMLHTLNEAYKVLQLQQQNLTGLRGFYLITLGGAKALNLEEQLGSFEVGKEADFVVLNYEGATPLLKRRLQFSNTLEERLFVLMMLGDDRSTMATYVDGRLAYNSKQK